MPILKTVCSQNDASVECIVIFCPELKHQISLVAMYVKNFLGEKPRTPAYRGMNSDGAEGRGRGLKSNQFNLFINQHQHTQKVVQNNMKIGYSYWPNNLHRV